MEQSSGPDIWGGIWGRVFRWADWSIDDAMGMHNQPPVVIQYPEQVPPASSDSPRESWLSGAGGNAVGLGLALVAGAAAVWLVLKK